MEFVWSGDSSEYAIRDGNMVKIFKNFKEKKVFKPEAGTEGMVPLLVFLIIIKNVLIMKKNFNTCCN